MTEQRDDNRTQGRCQRRGTMSELRDGNGAGVRLKKLEDNDRAGWRCQRRGTMTEQGGDVRGEGQ